jgi:hypothetical protein
MPEKCKQCTIADDALAALGGVWITACDDLSGISVYASELDALRAANGTGMVTLFVGFGMDLLKAVRRA